MSYFGKQQRARSARRGDQIGKDVRRWSPRIVSVSCVVHTWSAKSRVEPEPEHRANRSNGLRSSGGRALVSASVLCSARLGSVPFNVSFLPTFESVRWKIDFYRLVDNGKRSQQLIIFRIWALRHTSGKVLSFIWNRGSHLSKRASLGERVIRHVSAYISRPIWNVPFTLWERWLSGIEMKVLSKTLQS